MYLTYQILAGFYALPTERCIGTCPRQVKYESRLTRGLSAGRWYLSVVNDNAKTCYVSFYSESVETSCPNGCSQNGHCFESKCSCFPGWSGSDCSVGICTPICSANGFLSGSGSCICYPGWKGAQCDVLSTVCEDPTCSSNGKCVNGKCVCNDGFTGSRCDQVDCPKNCSQNGVCLNSGVCRCFAGYSGPDCSLPNETLKCNQNGIFLAENSSCFCNDGFTGALCDQLVQQNVTISRCDPPCENDGSCYLNNGQWTCQCPAEYHGPSCEVKKETSCGDGLDNDNDGLVDCTDPDCCSATICSATDACQQTNRLTLRGRLESFSAQIRSILSQIQQNARLKPSSDVSLLHGVVRDRYAFPMQGVSISSKYGKSYSRSDGTYQLVVERACTEVTFSRTGFQLVEEIVCPSNDYYAVVPVRMITTTDEMVQYRLPPPVTVSAASDLAGRMFSSSVPVRVPVNVETKRIDFVSTILDGTMQLRLVNPTRDSNRLYIQFVASAEYTEVRAFCNGAEIGARTFTKLSPGQTVDLEFNWNFLDFFGSRVYGLGICEVLIGSKYTAESSYIWGRNRAEIVAQRPSKFQGSDIGGFRTEFDSFFDLKNQLIYHVTTDTIQKISFGHQKEIVDSVNLEQIDQIYKSNSDIIVFSRKSGVWKLKSGNAPIRRFFQAPDAIGFAAGESGQEYILTFSNRILKIRPDGESEIIHRGAAIAGPVTVDKLQNVYFLQNQIDLYRMTGSKVNLLTRNNRNALRNPPCLGEMRRLIDIQFLTILALEYSPYENAILLVDQRPAGNILLKVFLDTPDMWTTLVSGFLSHCDDNRENFLDKLNSIKTTPDGVVLFSTSDQIIEILPSGAQQVVFGSCVSASCEIMGKKSAARFEDITAFYPAGNGELIVAEEPLAAKPRLSIVKPNKPKKASSGYEIGFPDENLLREYLIDGRLVQIKDLYTKKSIKYLKYSGSRLAEISDQFGNTIKITHESKARILLQNSRNYQRAQIMLENGQPVRIQDEDGLAKFEWTNSQLSKLDDITFRYTDNALTGVTLSNFSLTLSSKMISGQFNSGFETGKCPTKFIKYELGRFARSREYFETTSFSADSTLRQSSADWSNTDIFCIDSISNQPVKFALIESRGLRAKSNAAIPDRTNEWISILNKESHVKRMRREGATLMSYELDFSKSTVIKGRFYDEIMTFVGELDLDPRGPLEKLKVTYQRSGSPVYHVVKFKYENGGVLTGWNRTQNGRSNGVRITRGRTGKITEIAPHSGKPYKINHKRNQIEIITPSGSAHLIGYKIGGSKWSDTEYAITYPIGDRYNLERKVSPAGNEMTTYSRNGIDFQIFEKFEDYRKITNINDDGKLTTVEVYDCFGNIRLIRSPIDERRFLSDQGVINGVSYPTNGVELVATSSGQLTTAEKVVLNSNSVLKMEYFYDSWHRSYLSRVNIIGYRTVSRDWSYDGDKLSSVDKFNFIHFTDNSLYQISATQPRVIFTKKYDYATGKIIAQQLEIGGSHIYNSVIGQLENDKIDYEEFEVLTQGNKTRLKFEYDEDDILIRSPTETMSYRARLLDSIYSTNGIQVTIGRDHFNRLIRFGAIQLKWSEKGLVQIGAETLEWDHRANPIKLNSQSLLYDHCGRLRQIGQSQHIIYANQNFPNRITHHVSGHDMTEYFYDLNGALFAIMRRNLIDDTSELFYVVTLSDHSPRFIFSQSGAIVKEVQYSAFGRMTFNSNPDFEVIIGHKGQLCLGHICYDHLADQWRQTLTDEGVFFSTQTKQLDAISQSANDNTKMLQGVNKHIWPYHSDLKFTFINSRKDRILEKYFQHLNQPFLPKV